MSDQHKPLTAAEIEELRRIAALEEPTLADLADVASQLDRLLSMLTPPTDTELREAVERMECVLLSRLLDGVANVEVMYADLSVLLRAAKAPRLTPEQVEAVKTAHANLLAHACPNDEDVAERLEREFPGVFGKEG